MSLLPFLSRFIVPTMLSLYISLSTFFPIHPIQKSDEHSSPTVKTITRKTTEPSHPTTVSPQKNNEETSGNISKAPKETANVSVSTTPIPTVHETVTPSQRPSSKDKGSQITTTPDAQKTITATTTITTSGKTIALSMSYPENGGALSGKITGDCTGTISGSYDGPSTSSFTGTGNATCPVGFISVPVTITFTGKLLSPSQATINYIVSAMGQNQTGNTTVNLTE